MNHPENFFGKTPELWHCRSDNLILAVSHLKWPRFELPIDVPTNRSARCQLIDS
jgi:hypothetical protein